MVKQISKFSFSKKFVLKAKRKYFAKLVSERYTYANQE